LIAEDEVLGKCLSKHWKKSHTVIVLQNGELLLETLAKESPALVVLDLIMPVKNGFQVLEEMKKNTKYKKIKVLALSNLGQDEEVEKAKKLGCDDYIIKSDETLYEVITKIEKHLN
jgi:DNA-binding response OmpR family regulator